VEADLGPKYKWEIAPQEGLVVAIQGEDVAIYKG
jgi:hypothetical protein